MTRPTKQKATKPARKHDLVAFVEPKTITVYTKPPSNWPAELPYLSTNLVSALVTESQKTLVATLNSKGLSTTTVYSSASNPLVTIQKVAQSHPAFPHSGLFAARSLSSGTWIIDYTGLLHSCPLPSCATSDYDLAFLERDASLAICSASMGNEGRFVNDYHGIRDGPNAVFEEYFAKVKEKGKDVWQARMGIWVKPGEEIKKGDEICVSYGKGWWRARQIACDDFE